MVQYGLTQLVVRHIALVLVVFTVVAGTARADDSSAEGGATFASVALNVCGTMLEDPGQIASSLKSWRALPINPEPLRRHDPNVLHAVMIVSGGLDFIVALKRGPTCGAYLREFGVPERLAPTFARFYKDEVSNGLCEGSGESHPAKLNEIKCLTGPRENGLAVFGVMAAAVNPKERGYAALATFGLVNHEETMADFQTKND